MRRLLIIAVLLLPVALQAQVIPTNEWVSLWSDHSVLDFSSVPVGSVVRAYDPQGVLCGEFTATASGAYGLMPVYRDDVTTVGIDEGAEPADIISFTIDDVPAIPFGPDAAVWTANGDIRRVNLAAGLADLDIKPGSCPNMLNALSPSDPPTNARSMRGSILPVAILGTANLDVHDIDIASLRLEGVEPVRHSYEDVAVPIAGGGECGCGTGGSDGFMDLTLKFRSTEIIAALGAFSDGQQRVLTVSGTLADGTPLRASDCVGVLAKSPREPGLPSLSSSGGVVLQPAVPNPFNPVTRIHYILPNEAYVRLTVYDVTGKVVDHLVAHVQPAGEHVAAWDAGTYPSGIYFYRLEVGRFSETRKLILLK